MHHSQMLECLLCASGSGGLGTQWWPDSKWMSSHQPCPTELYSDGGNGQLKQTVPTADLFGWGELRIPLSCALDLGAWEHLAEEGASNSRPEGWRALEPPRQCSDQQTGELTTFLFRKFWSVGKIQPNPQVRRGLFWYVATCPYMKGL